DSTARRYSSRVLPSGCIGRQTTAKLKPAARIADPTTGSKPIGEFGARAMSGAVSKRRVLCVDDSRLTREQVRDALGDRVNLERADGAEAGIGALEREPVDLVLSDLQMGGMSGLALLGRARRIAPGVPFVLLTAHASVDSAVEALRHGATDYLQKP